MPVFFVVGNVKFERRELGASFRRYTFRGRFFLRHYGLQLQFAELHVCSDTEQRRCSLYE